MTIWMDLTNSMVTWQGGIVGIIRVELETAKTLKQLYPEIRYSVFKQGSFEDITDSVSWLWQSDNASTAYLERRKRDQKTVLSKDKSGEDDQNSLLELKKAYSFSDSRYERLKEAGKLWISCLPTVLHKPCWRAMKLALLPAKRIYNCRKKHREKKVLQQQKLLNQKYETKTIIYPYKDGDVVFSCGWYASGKENAFTQVRNQLKKFRIAYLVYDLVLLKPETAHFYHEYDYFAEYLHWISRNCDHIFYWGKTTQNDTESFFQRQHWRIPNGSLFYCCSKMKVNMPIKDIQGTLKRLGITQRYVMMVGSLEAKKNYDVVYRAYRIMMENNTDDVVPQCVIIGSNFGSCKDLLNSMRCDPVVNKKFIFVRATDEELDLLYKNAMFTMLPSFYEGWSIVMAEMLSYGKLCIAADVEPLREVAEDLAVYVNPLDPASWANAILRYSNSPQEIAAYESVIKDKWHPPTWQSGAKHIYSELKKMSEIPTVYYDLTLGYAYAFSEKPALTGIPRTVLLMARNLFRYVPDLKFFALVEGGYISLTYYDLHNTIEGEELDSDFQKDAPTIQKKPIEVQRTIVGKPDITMNNSKQESNAHDRFVKAQWLLASVCNGKMQKMILKTITRYKGQEVAPEGCIHSLKTNIEYRVDFPFRKNDIVLTLGPGFSEWISICLQKAKEKEGFKIVQTLYDMTPVLLPHTHTTETLKSFINEFLPYVYRISDYIVYGGKTAMRDGEAYARKQGWPLPKAIPIKWGNDFNAAPYTEERRDSVFNHYGIKTPYILTVGTLQKRKNQEILYHAFLYLIENRMANDVQLVIAGYPGWGYSDFLQHLSNDKRIKGRIIMITPSDEELNILYQNCLFTVLPSLYEGWSLTLPESLEYGKLCLAARVDPLIEIGGDLIDYVEPYHTIAWAKAIAYYTSNPDKLKQREQRIRKEWKGTTWDDCAKSLAETLENIV